MENGFGGHTALDFLIKVRDIPFREAIQMLSETEPFLHKSICQNKIKPEKSKPFVLPKAAKYPNQAVRYLQDRGIHPDIIRYALDNKMP